MADGEKELYDVTKDPFELNNVVRVRNLFPIRAFLHAQLIRLEACVGRTCQEVAPPFPLTAGAAEGGASNGAKKNGGKNTNAKKSGITNGR